MQLCFNLILSAVLLATPLAAQDTTMLISLAAGLTDQSGTKLMSAAAAACILGGGDGDTAAKIFTDAGWTRSDDAEMGETALYKDGADVGVTLYEGGVICDVASEKIATDGAISALQIMAGSTGLSLRSIDTPDGCQSYQLTDTASVVISSTGQDPSCEASPTSALRFTFSQ